MKNLIIKMIVRYWDRICVVERHMVHRFKDLAFEIMNLSTMLDTLKIENPHIVLHGKNSFQWIVVYITAIIKNIPLTVLPKFSVPQLRHFIQETGGNILFIDDIENLSLFNNVTLAAKIVMGKSKFKLTGINTRLVNNIDKKYRKWDRLSEITDIPLNLTPEVFQSFKEKALPEPAYFTMFTSGVSNSPRIKPISLLVVLRAVKGMTKLLAKNKLRGKSIYVKAPFSFFASVTFMPILSVGGTVLLHKRFRNAEAVIGDTQWYEGMWDYNTEFMSEKNRMSFEKWWLTKWINTIKLKNTFNKVFEDSMKTFIILNDQTHVRLRQNMERIGYKVFSTYGTTNTAQLISIDNRLIKGIKTKIRSEDPTTIKGELAIQNPIGFLSGVWERTRDIVTVGPDSELIIHGRKDNRVTTSSGSILYAEEIEDIARAHPFINQCVRFQRKGKVLLGVYFIPFRLDARKKTKADSINITIALKEELNYHLPRDASIDSFVIFSKPLETNVLGKVIRYFNNAPHMFGGIGSTP